MFKGSYYSLLLFIFITSMVKVESIYAENSDIDNGIVCNSQNSQYNPLVYSLSYDSKKVTDRFKCDQLKSEDLTAVQEKSDSETLKVDDLCSCLKSDLPKLSKEDIAKLQAAVQNDEMAQLHAKALGVQTAFAREALYEFDAYMAATDEEKTKGQMLNLQKLQDDSFFTAQKICSDEAVFRADENSLCKDLDADGKLRSFFRQGQIKASGVSSTTSELARRAELSATSVAVINQLANREKLISIIEGKSSNTFEGDNGRGFSDSDRTELELLLPKMKSISYPYMSQVLVKNEKGILETSISINVEAFLKDFQSLKTSMLKDEKILALDSAAKLKMALAKIEEINYTKAASHCSTLNDSMNMICNSKGNGENAINFTAYYSPLIKTKFENESIIMDKCKEVKEAIDQAESRKSEWNDKDKFDFDQMRNQFYQCLGNSDRQIFKDLSEKAVENLSAILVNDGGKERAEDMIVAYSCYNLDKEIYGHLVDDKAKETVASIPSEIKKGDAAQVLSDSDVISPPSDSNTSSEATIKNTEAALAEAKNEKVAETKKAVSAQAQSGFNGAKAYIDVQSQQNQESALGTIESALLDTAINATTVKQTVNEVAQTNESVANWDGINYDLTTGAIVKPIAQPLPNQEEVSEPIIKSAPLNDEQLSQTVQSQPAEVFTNNNETFKSVATPAQAQDVANIESKAKDINARKFKLSSLISDKEKLKDPNKLELKEKEIADEQLLIKAKEEALAAQIEKLISENKELREALKEKSFIDKDDLAKIAQTTGSNKAAARSVASFASPNASYGNGNNSSFFPSTSGFGNNTQTAPYFQSPYNYEAGRNDGNINLIQGNKVINAQYDLTASDPQATAEAYKKIQALDLSADQQSLIDDYLKQYQAAGKAEKDSDFDDAFIEVIDQEGKKQLVKIMVPASTAHMGELQFSEYNRWLQTQPKLPASRYDDLLHNLLGERP